MNDQDQKLIEDSMRGIISHKQLKAKLSFKLDSTFLEDYLSEAINLKSDVTVEDGFYLGFAFSLFTPSHVGLLCKLSKESWHSRHEDIAIIFKDLKDVKSVECLFEMAMSNFDYFDFDDEHYALGVKCVWALWAIGGVEAIKKLKLLAESTQEPIKEAALHRLEDLDS